MNTRNQANLASAIITKAKTLGASLAGLVRVADLKKAPSFTLAQMLAETDRQGGNLGEWPGIIAWPENAQSVLVIAVEHPADKPEMDWWFGESDPSGNRLLARIIKDLSYWIEVSIGFQTFHMPYHVANGGTFLKDAAAMAGLGCIGKNNLLVTPEYGPRVRLRALTLDAFFPATGPAGFDPCMGCDAPCRQSCPQSAFDAQVYKTEDGGPDRLPGRSGVFSRPLCSIQMEKDIAAAEEKKIEPDDKPVKVIKYCRSCEFACPVGR